MRLIVCGGRDYQDYEFLSSVLDAAHRIAPISALIQGGAQGADALAKRWAARNEVECIEVKAQWSVFGRNAGPMRNKEMLSLRPSHCFAFPGGSGTADMTRKAIAAGVLTSRFNRDEKPTTSSLTQELFPMTTPTTLPELVP